jgi:hypothetical protein
VNSIEQELTILLDWIFPHWGFCIPVDDRLRISRSESLGAREFAMAVLRAEGFSTPETETKWMRLLTARFVEHFGADGVSVDSATQI